MRNQIPNNRIFIIVAGLSDAQSQIEADTIHLLGDESGQILILTPEGLSVWEVVQVITFSDFVTGEGK